MCTVTYYPTGDGYMLFFNRDESRARPLCKSPRKTNSGKIEVIYPTDTASHGTWLAVNQIGITLCQLNALDYRNRYNTHGEKSRARIVKKLLSCHSEEDIRTTFNLLNVNHYSGFELIAIIPRPDREPKILHWIWNGKILQSYHNHSGPQLWSTSPLPLDEIKVYRKNLWTELQVKNPVITWDVLKSFHCNEGEKPTERSLAMKSDSIKTINISGILVSPDTVKFEYLDGSPWKNPASLELSMPRVIAPQISTTPLSIPEKALRDLPTPAHRLSDKPIQNPDQKPDH